METKNDHFDSRNMGKTTDRRHGQQAISGRVHLGMQAIQQRNADLPRIFEDKSNHFSGYLTPQEMEEAHNATVELKRKLRIDDDVPLCNPSKFSKQEWDGKTSSEADEMASTRTSENETQSPNDEEVPSPPKNRMSLRTDKHVLKDRPWVIKQSSNEPHPVLEVPPLYFFVKSCPGAHEAIKTLYQARWRVSYPLQRRVFLSQYLRKLGIFFTWGELFLLLPFIGMIIGGVLSTFIFPSVSISGHTARLALILALATAMHNSLITLLIGLPFERALWYHKLSGRIALLNGVLHTIVAHQDAIEKAVLPFLFEDQMNASGTGLAMICGGLILTSFPSIRRRAFEFFYYAHIVFVTLMTVCAFYHTGILIPVLASLLWGVDLFMRKIVMASCRYPRKARIRIVSDTVVELNFPKTKCFDYNAGQHLSIAVPELSIFEWHPFSIATCPREKNVTILIRVAGDWTSALYKLAETKDEISILVEGPNGSPSVDIFNANRYKSFLLFSGGIGVTPIQSVLNQLVYDQSKKRRNLKRIRCIWTDRDPVLMEDVDVVQNSSRHYSAPFGVEDLDLKSLASAGVFSEDDSQNNSMASALLACVPPGRRTDAELKHDYPLDSDTPVHKDGYPKQKMGRRNIHSTASVADESTFHAAFESSSLQDILDMQVYLTSKETSLALSNLPFVHYGRPDIDQIFAATRDEALSNGLCRVAVFVCAPSRLARAVQNACVKFSDGYLQFDVHLEYQD